MKITRTFDAYTRMVEIQLPFMVVSITVTSRRSFVPTQEWQAPEMSLSSVNIKTIEDATMYAEAMNVAAKAMAELTAMIQ
jgi:hypothetical protein